MLVLSLLCLIKRGFLKERELEIFVIVLSVAVAVSPTIRALQNDLTSASRPYVSLKGIPVSDSVLKNKPGHTITNKSVQPGHLNSNFIAQDSCNSRPILICHSRIEIFSLQNPY